jgi:hypothetical protein
MRPYRRLSSVMTTDNFATRLHEALHLAHIPERQRAAWITRTCGVSRASASKWLGGQAVPDRARWAAMAEALGVRVEWLAFGLGPVRSDAAPSVPASPVSNIDPALLAEIMQIVDSVPLALEPTSRIRLALALYEQLKDRLR